jgi:hypothetical protein
MNIHLLEHNFNAASANTYKNKHLWVKSAALFPNQLQDLFEFSNLNKIKIVNINSFKNDSNQLKLLKSIFDKNKTDKSNGHNYHIIYNYVINIIGRNKNINLLEIGLGTNNPSLISSMGVDGIPGASLISFKEYLPNSRIFGADIDKDILFTEDRINTSYVDQLDKSSFLKMNKNFGNIKYDIIIDDGLHSLSANLNTLLFGLENININGWIIIEDICKSQINNWNIIDSILNTNDQYDTFMVDTNMWSWVYVVKRIY